MTSLLYEIVDVLQTLKQRRVSTGMLDKHQTYLYVETFLSLWKKAVNYFCRIRRSDKVLSFLKLTFINMSL